MPNRDSLSVAIAARWSAADGFALATINLDHLVKLRRDDGFARDYAAQDFVVADGNPIVWLSHIAGRPVELMPGSDLVVPLCQLAAENGVRVALVGSTGDALKTAAARLQSLVPGLEIAYQNAPPFGFDPTSENAAQILTDVDASGARLCFLALGAPKQESLAARGREIAPHVGFVSVGAGLDFLAGTQTRAPRLVRLLKLEWLWRLALSPTRLWRRYASCAAILPPLYREARALRRRSPRH